MTEEKNIREVEIYGRLITQTASYDLLAPHPVDLDSWVEKFLLLCFYVCITPANVGVTAVPRHIIVSGNYVIDYGYAGKKIKIQVNEEAQTNQINIKDSSLWKKLINSR